MDVRDTVVVDRATAANMAAAHSTSNWQRDVSYDENPTRRRRGPWVALVIAIVVGLASFGGWWLAAGPGKTVPTPDLLGLSTSQAQSALAAAGLTFELAEEVFSEEIPADVVVSTDPAPGDGVREAGSVAATISKGPERYQVPDVQGLTPEAAIAAINAANLAAGGRVEGFSNDIPAGSVSGTDPKIGESLKPLTPVDLVVSKGPKPVVIANVVGKRAPASKTTLESAGLVVTSSTKFSEKVADGRVISVSPAAGTKVDSGSSVALVISKGPPPVVVPNLVDLPRRKAVAALTAVGLKAKVEAGAFTPLNRVISQSPAAGQEIPKGSTVTIRII
jgi:serine/threonine-protein kinase